MTPRSPRLRPVEVAEAAILVDVTLALELAGWLLPFGGVLQALAIVPLAALGWRHRPRAVLLGTAAGAFLAFLVGGAGLGLTIAGSGVIGLIVGGGLRRGWGGGRVTALSLVAAGVPGAGLTVAGLAVLTALRHLALAQVRLTWRGVARIAAHFGLHQVVGWGNAVVSWSITHWWATVPAGELVLLAWVTGCAVVFAGPVLERLARATSAAGEAGVAWPAAGPA
ncbi:MAG: hypothetical protein ACRDZQ_08065, partial [Acidimicrobiales bacterium]